MKDSPIQHVGDTAFWVATFRAREAERPDALFRDPLAARLVAGRGESIAARMAGGGVVGWAVVIRTCIIDDFIRLGIAQGCDAVLNLGAGLDTRPYRLELPPSLRWIEVDFPETIAFKEERLRGERPRCQLERLGVDLADIAQRDALLGRVASRSAKVLVLSEGLIPYLDNDAVSSLAAALRLRPNFAFWIVESLAPQVDRMRPHRRQMARAPFKFKPGNWTAFFEERGWSVKERRSLVDEAVRRNRLPALSFGMRLLLLFTSRKRREQMRGAYAYILLERRA